MQISPGDCQPGDKFLHRTSGVVWTLVKIQEAQGTSLAGVLLSYPDHRGTQTVSERYYSIDQPDFLAVPRGATQGQIEALRAILK